MPALLAFAMAGVFHILYRLLFQEIDGFLKSSGAMGASGALRSALASLILLALAFPVYRWLLSDERPISRLWSTSRKAPTHGLDSPVALGAALLTGILAGALVMGLSSFWPSSPSPLPGAGSILFIVGLTPIAEELYFRYLMQGYLMESMQRVSAPAWAVATLPLAFSVLCFAFSHHYFIAPVLLIPGLASGLVFLRWGVLASMVTHSAYNAVLIGGAYAFS